jgi:hypothetical protein
VRRSAPMALGVFLVVGALAIGIAAIAAVPGATRRAGTTSTSTTGPPVTHGLSHFAHVMVVVMENLSYASALATPGFAALAHRYAYATDSYAASHPSLPNYLALTAGSTFGRTSDCLTCYVTADNLAAQLSAAHVSWGDFSEGVSAPCYLGTSYGSYAAKHNPFRYYADVRTSPALCAHLLPLSVLTDAARRGASAVPAFSFVVPDVCHDGHDCAPAVAAAWLTGFLAAVTASAAWRDHGLVIVTWDESEGDDSAMAPSGQVVATGGGGHILTMVLAHGAPRGTVLTAPLTDDAILATIERNFGLGYLGGAAAWRTHVLEVPGT